MHNYELIEQTSQSNFFPLLPKNSSKFYLPTNQKVANSSHYISRQYILKALIIFTQSGKYIHTTFQGHNTFFSHVFLVT